MTRRRTFLAFREAQDLGAYAELPMLPGESQLQLRLSRNRGSQPFHSLFSKDTLLVVLSGGGHVRFCASTVRAFALEPGDCIYVPAGTPHHLQHTRESVMLRYVPQPDCAEGVAWYCPNCNRELYRKVWDLSVTLPQHGYLAACQAFNDSESLRQCSECQYVHSSVEVNAFHWEDIARRAATP